MLKPENLRIRPRDPYVFKSTLKRKAVGLFDFVGGLFFSQKVHPVELGKLKKIAVLRLDHIGDVILAFPFLRELSRLAPQAQIDLYVGPWAKDVVELSGLPINCVVFQAAWFDRSGNRNGENKNASALCGALKEGGYDAAFDLRGDLRHIYAMWKAGIPVRAGQGMTGGGFWLTHSGAVPAGTHEVDKNLDLLARTGNLAPFVGLNPSIQPSSKDLAEAGKISRSIGIKQPVIVFHVTCAAAAKQWPVASWRQLIDRFPASYDVVIIGSDNESKAMMEVATGCQRKVLVASGRFGLGPLAAFLKESRLFVGVNSGPGHIAAAVNVPVVSLFSGSDAVEEWSPRGNRVTVIHKRTVCSPCQRAECPIGNECMRQIGVDEVFQAAEKWLG